MNRRRSARIKAHIISDTMGFFFGLIPAIILIAIGTPTWGWLTIGFVIWSIASNRIFNELMNDPEFRRYLR